MHHIISDGWSLNVLAKDVSKNYELIQENSQEQLPALRIQYKDYAAWQQDHINGDHSQIHKDYWLEKLKGNLPKLNLPTNKVRPKLKSYKGNSFRAIIDGDSTIKARNFIETHGGSLFTLLVTSWNILFHRYTGEEDIIFGKHLPPEEMILN